MSWVMSSEDIPQLISEFMLSLSDNKWVILLVINLILLFVGSFMDITPAVLIFTPIFLPVVTKVGVDPVHFGIMMVVNLCIGLCTPPVGSLLFVGVSIAKISLTQVLRPILPFFLAMLFALVLLVLFPEITLALPRFFGLI
jgi:tripartite ATP-independent transporter DctM subunit